MQCPCLGSLKNRLIFFGPWAKQKLETLNANCRSEFHAPVGKMIAAELDCNFPYEHVDDFMRTSPNFIVNKGAGEVGLPAT